MTSIEPLSLSELRDLSRDHGAAAAFSPLTGRAWFLFEAGARRLPVADGVRIAGWLRSLPCPTIGLFPVGGHTHLRKACDVVLENHDEVKALLPNLQKNPLAATVFVQLLRATEKMEIEAALTGESLAYATLQSGPEFKAWLAQFRPDAVRITDTGPPVLVERHGNTLALVLNRASNRNAISVEVRDALAESLQLVLSDPTIKKLSISGRGRCFSVGGDLNEFGTVPDPVTGYLVRNLALPGRLLALCADRAEVHVHGACIGAGIEFPAFAGRVVAGPDAFFQLPELKFGLIPGAGGCVSIARRIGRQNLAQWVIAGRRVNAQQALQWGLVDEIAPLPE